MNVNPLLMNLKDIVGCPVVQDLYQGKEPRWLVFTYADERGELYADGVEVYTTATLTLSYYTPVSYNYFADKKKIKKALLDMGFNVEDIYTRVDGNEEGTEYIRHTVFDINITKMEEL